MIPLQRERSSSANRRLLGVFALTCAATACAAPAPHATGPATHTAPTSAASPPSADGSSAASAERDADGAPARDCEALALAWRSEWVAEGEVPDPEVEAELAERRDEFPCELELDLDGDHADERIFITSAGRDRVVGIGIEWSDGHWTLLGGGNPVEMQPAIDKNDDPIVMSDFDWIVHWKPAPLREGEFEVDVLGKPIRFEAPGALGDGVEVSGTDAAAIIYFDGSEWRWLHLGF